MLGINFRFGSSHCPGQFQYKRRVPIDRTDNIGVHILFYIHIATITILISFKLQVFHNINSVKNLFRDFLSQDNNLESLK